MTNSGHSTGEANNAQPRTCSVGLDRRRRPHLHQCKERMDSTRRDCPWPEPKTN